MKFEISHDMLAKQVHEKAGAEAKARRRVKAMVEREMARVGTLLRQEDLDEISPFEKEIDFDDAELKFIKDSKAAIQKAARRKRRALRATIASLSALALVSLIFAFSAWRASKKVEAKAREGMANDLAFKASVEPDRTTAFRLAELSNQIDPGNYKALQQLLNLTNPDLPQAVHSTFYGSENIGTHADFSRDGSMVATAQYPFSLSAWEVESGNLILNQKFSEEEVLDSATVIKFSPKGSSIILGTMMGKLLIQDMSNPQDFRLIGLGSSPLLSMDISPDENIIAAGFKDGTVKIFDVGSGEIELVGHKDEVKATAFKDSITVYSFSTDGNLRIWDVRTGKLISTKEFGVPAVINHDEATGAMWSTTPAEAFWQPIFTDNANMIYSKYIWGQFKYVDISTGEKADSEEPQPFNMTAFDYSSDGTHSVKLGMDSIYFHHRKDDHLIRMGIPKDLTGELAMSEYGSLFWTSTEPDNERVWNTNVQSDLDEIYNVLRGDLRFRKFNSIHTKFLEFTGDKELNLINLINGSEERIDIDIDDLRIAEIVDYQLDHALIKTESKFQLELWNLKTNSREWLRKGISVFVEIKTLSQDGSLFAVSSDGGIDIWDTQKDELINTYSESNSYVKSVEFCRCENLSVQGRSKNLLLIGSDDKLARLWDPVTGKVLKIFPVHKAVVTKVGFANNEDMVITGDSEGSVVFWSFDTANDTGGHEEFSIQTNKGAIVDFDHSTSGEKIVIVNTGQGYLNVSHSADIYDIKSGNLIASLSNKHRITNVSFTHSDRILIADNNLARVRSLDPAELIFDFKNTFRPSYLSIAALNKYEIHKIHDAKKGYFKNLKQEMDEEKMINISDYYIDLGRSTSNLSKRGEYYKRATGILLELRDKGPYNKLSKDQINAKIEDLVFGG